MIESSVIEFIVDKLDKERETISAYMMEYTVALFLNIVLIKEGVEKCASIKTQVLSTLINLMEY